MRGTLKEFYQRTFRKMDQLEHNLIYPSNVELLNKFVELTVVDAIEAERDAVNIAERVLFLQRQMNYKPIKFDEVFSKEQPLLLISGIAGIGKSWLLRKCLLDWANDDIWKNDALDFQKHKCVVAGRVEAILRYKSKVTECRDKLNIQIMGFNDNGINKYVEKVGEGREALKDVLKSSPIAKAMASVPFYLSAMCTVIGSSTLSGLCSFFTMTELYSCIFMYFLQKHINKNNEPVCKMMEKESSKQLILKVCKIAFHLFNQGKVVFSKMEINSIVNDIDKVEIDHLGFIEKVESQLGYQYQFVHLTLMEFCASIHAYINLSHDEILSNEKLRSCLPMICGLKNKNEKCFVRFLANLKTSKEECSSMFGKFMKEY